MNGFYYQMHSLKLENSDSQFIQTQEMFKKANSNQNRQSTDRHVFILMKCDNQGDTGVWGQRLCNSERIARSPGYYEASIAIGD